MPDLPIPAPALPALSPAARRRAFLSMWLVDHGFIRDVYCNVHRLTDHAWRSAQPSPRHLRWARRSGIRTILNLRGRRETCGSYLLEREACQQLGLTMVDFPVRSRQPLDRETLLAAAELFPTLRHPVLMHCKSGADRAGLMATLYLHLHEGVPMRLAMRQLSLRYGHIKHAKTGVIDFFFESYLADQRERGLSFLDWVADVYDPVDVLTRFRDNWLASFLVNRVLRRE
ncbi:MAG: protein tyrosine phosphatase [Rhodospirillales bacterium]|nr:MAG: protein tyrosine phosphatase [Rhodospirillales bacterium]